MQQTFLNLIHYKNKQEFRYYVSVVQREFYLRYLLGRVGNLLPT